MSTACMMVGILVAIAEGTPDRAAPPLVGALGPCSTEGGAVKARQRGGSTGRRIAAARALVAAGADVRAPEPGGLTPLHCAAALPGREGPILPFVQELLRRGAVVDARTAAGVTPLRLAVERRHLRVAAALVSARADLQARDDQLQTPAGLLEARGMKDALARLQKVADDAFLSPLHRAAGAGDVAGARRLLRRRAPVDATDVNGRTPLASALGPYVAELGADAAGAEETRTLRKVQVARLLIAAGANVKAPGPLGTTPLHLAVAAEADERSVVPVVRDLLRRGAAADARAVSGVTPLLVACRGKRVKIAALLVRAGADLDAADVDGRTPARALEEQGMEDALASLRKLHHHRADRRRRPAT